MKCPACESVALRERKLRRKVAVDSCPQCQGTWLDGDELNRFIKGDQTAKEVLELLAFDPLISLQNCPRCEVFLRTSKLNGTEIWLDYCAECSGLWFDAGELKGVIKAMQKIGQQMKRSDSSQTCPKCQAHVAESSVLCIDCGYDFRTKDVRQTSAERVLSIGASKLVIRRSGDSLLLSIPRRFRPTLFGFHPAVVNLAEYAAIFTFHQSQTKRRRDNDEYYDEWDYYEASLMKYNWLGTVRVRLHSIDSSANDNLRDFTGFVTESAPDIEVLPGPPSRYWGKDQRRWWQEWDFGMRPWNAMAKLIGIVCAIGFVVYWLFNALRPF